MSQSVVIAPPADRTVRNLARLETSGSTSRTLNLVSVWKRRRNEASYYSSPFFKNPILNRSIILKHRVRRHEAELLVGKRTNATKVVLPIDLTDLRVGARSFFVGEASYKQLLESVWRNSETGRARDLELLELLDTLPSFDPFLMRERLRRANFHPARWYFDLSEADAARMASFVAEEVTPLVGRSFDSKGELAERTTKLANKLMADPGDADLSPLRLSMAMGQAEFEEGVFCWKGFIYYKWMVAQLLPQAGPVLNEIGRVRRRAWKPDQAIAIGAAQASLTNSVMRSLQEVRSTLGIYASAYADLTENGKPNIFRDFLLQAPSLFYDMGERLGAVQHMVSFWRYRFPNSDRASLTADDMIDLLTDFQNSLGDEPVKPVAYVPLRA